MVSVAEEKSKKRLAEVVKDIEKKKHIMSEWELNFLNTLQRMAHSGKGVLDLSDAQLMAFERMERKIYA